MTRKKNIAYTANEGSHALTRASSNSHEQAFNNSYHGSNGSIHDISRWDSIIKFVCGWSKRANEFVDVAFVEVELAAVKLASVVELVTMRLVVVAPPAIVRPPPAFPFPMVVDAYEVRPPLNDSKVEVALLGKR